MAKYSISKCVEKKKEICHRHHNSSIENVCTPSPSSCPSGLSPQPTSPSLPAPAPPFLPLADASPSHPKRLLLLIMMAHGYYTFSVLPMYGVSSFECSPKTYIQIAIIICMWGVSARMVYPPFMAVAAVRRLGKIVEVLRLKCVTFKWKELCWLML